MRFVCKRFTFALEFMKIILDASEMTATMACLNTPSLKTGVPDVLAS